MLLELGPFDGGLNLRDSYDEIARNELSDGTNFTLDERGVATKRNDCPTTTALAGASTPPGAVTAFFYSQVLNLFICQVGTTTYKAAPGAGAWTSWHVFTSSDPVAFADFAGVLLCTHPLDGLFSYAGGGGATLQAAGRNGTCIATWQNKCFVGGVPSASGGRNRLYWSGVGSFTAWDTNDFVDFREKDDKPHTALFGGSGLLVFKENSTSRVNDSTTGAYQTIDWTTGAVGPLAVTSQDGRIIVWGVDGLYEGNGLGAFVSIGDKVRPIFLSSNVNATTKAKISGTSVNGRVYFAYPSSSATDPNAWLEYNPRVGWIMAGHIGGGTIGPFVKYPNSSGQQQVSFASGSAAIKDFQTGTTRTGYSCSFAAGYVQPFHGKRARLRQLMPELDPGAASALTLGAAYQDTGGAAQTFSVSQSFAAGGQQRPTIWPGLAGRAFQAKLDDSAAPLNALSVYRLGLDFLQLER